MTSHRVDGPTSTDTTVRSADPQLAPDGGDRVVTPSRSLPPPWTRPVSHPDRITVQVPDGATLAVLLPAVEKLLLAVAALEPHPYSRDKEIISLLPPPVGGRIALGALYRVWDGIAHHHHHHHHPSLISAGSSTDTRPTSPVMRLSARDVAILHSAAAALDQPTAQLAGLLAQAGAGRATRALTALLWALIPIAEPTPPPIPDLPDHPMATAVVRAQPADQLHRADTTRTSPTMADSHPSPLQPART